MARRVGRCRRLPIPPDSHPCEPWNIAPMAVEQAQLQHSHVWSTLSRFDAR